jgi:hypothetical protein
MSIPLILDLPPFGRLAGNRVHYRSDTVSYELECIEAKRGRGRDKWCLDIDGIGVEGKTPEAAGWGNNYGQLWVAFNGQVFGATLKNTGSVQGIKVRFELSTIINDPSFWPEST